ncbi:InlB B-repeat-containing protein [Clostridium sp. 3-3]|uniref:InlB B-repeat-containing protein n=1 Tax=Clostridium sp. 3-3 TaxID=2070757 RepID=UPI000CDAAFF5|nr:InlB B-repeat-containing protein [Clostridium sp. 3-3]POO87288.1 hypothetical protein C1H59_06605 [Clostridium sp. 3-3]
MRIKAKRIISLCLAVAIMATSVGYGPPAAGAVDLTSTAYKTDEYTATPSEAIRPDDKATPSEAVPPEEKATPSEAEKRFIRVEPEEIPEYYQKASYAGRKFWKFNDRYGDQHYRDFGFIQGEAEFPLWYEANNQGRVEDYLSINPDEEYYDLAPYVYTSIKPENEDWDILSGHVLTGMKTLFKKEKIKFKNWDSSSYDVWALTTFEADNEDGNEELSFYFYGKIKNEGEEGSGAEWYYADKNGNVLNKLISRSIRSLRSVYQLGLYFDIPWQLNSTKPNNTYDVTNQKTYNLPGLFDYGSNKSTHFGWVEGRNRAGNYADSSSGTTVFYNQDPAKVSTYASGRLYSQKYTIDLEKTYTSEYGAVWCPQDADVFIFCKQFENVSKGDFTTGNNYCIDTQAILVKRNTEFYASAAGIPKKDGFTFKGWYYYKSIIGGDVERVNIADDEKLIAGSSQKFTFIFPDWEANLNTVIFKDWDGTVLSEQKIYSGNPAIAPILPDIPGKVFTGWSKNFNSVISDMEIVAQYADVINVTINGNGGTVYGNEIYTMQAKIGKSWSSQLEGLVDNLKKEGSTFNKLYYLIDGTEYSLPQLVDSQDITIYVKWNRNQYKIIFDGNGGVSGTKTSVTTYAYYGDPALPPTPPVFTRQYRDFMGFANVKLNGVPITYETLVTGDATYYAVWDYHYTDIVYHDCIPDSEWTAMVTRWSGDSSQFSNPIHPGRAGYSGPYWYTQPDGKGSVLYTFGDLLKGLLDGKDTLDVYALWNLVSYRYYCFKNTAEDQKTFITVNYDVTMDDADLPEWEGENGKVFIGYSTSKTGGGDLYKRNCDLPLVSSTYLYAQYANASYAVTFKDWDGTILNTQEVDYGKDAVLPEEPSRTGYTFTGWDKESTNIQANTTITAKYSKNSYKLTLDGNGGTLVGKDTREQQLAYGDTFDQILAEGATEASQKYYTFAGWYTDKTGGSKYPGSGNTMPASNVTVYAHWTRTSNEVTYKDWDERIIDRQEIAIGGNATPPADPVRTGYTFTAWDKPSTNIQDHTIITAQYSINNHKLMLDGNGGMVNGSSTKVQQITYGASFDQALTDGRDQATRTYYTFEGWFSSPTGGSKYGYTGNKMPDADVSVYAHWTRTSNEVIYKDWDGKVIDRQDVVIGGDAKPPVNPSRTGYTFTGWDKESPAGIRNPLISKPTQRSQLSIAKTAIS